MTTVTMKMLVAPPENRLHWGRWAMMVKKLEDAGGQHTIEIRPALTRAQARSLRSAARYRGWGLHLAHTDRGSCVWLGERITR